MDQTSVNRQAPTIDHRQNQIVGHVQDEVVSVPFSFLCVCRLIVFLIIITNSYAFSRNFVVIVDSANVPKSRSHSILLLFENAPPNRASHGRSDLAYSTTCCRSKYSY